MEIHRTHKARLKMLIISIFLVFFVSSHYAASSQHFELNSELSLVLIYQNYDTEFPEDEKLNNLAESSIPVRKNSITPSERFDFLAQPILCYWQPPKIA